MLITLKNLKIKIQECLTIEIEEGGVQGIYLIKTFTGENVPIIASSLQNARDKAKRMSNDPYQDVSYVPPTHSRYKQMAKRLKLRESDCVFSDDFSIMGQ